MVSEVSTGARANTAVEVDKSNPKNGLQFHTTQDLRQHRSRHPSIDSHSSVAKITISQNFRLANRQVVEAEGTLPALSLNFSAQKASPSLLIKSPSLLMVVCMGDKEEKVGMVWMMSLRGLT